MPVNSVIEEKLKLLPGLPGVYIMKDAAGNIIYVGKAKILKNRVRQYFHKSANHTPKVAAMVSNIADFEYIITGSEFEALCLECNLIKENSPKYNILLKDDKHYPFIKITVRDEYPRLSLARKIEKDDARYFGPYPSSSVVYDTIDLLKNVFKLQFCKKVFPRDIGRERPCLYHSMHKCDAPCTGSISPEEYRKKIDNVCRFLDGNHMGLVKSVTEEMMAAAAATEYERAAEKRDLLSSIERVTKQQKVISASWGDIDIFAAAAEDDIAVACVFYVRGGKMVGSESFKQSNVLIDDTAALIEEFITAFYSRSNIVPKTVVSAEMIAGVDSLGQWLSQKRGASVSVKVPVRGDLKKLADMAKINAGKALSDYKIDLLKKIFCMRFH